MSTRRRATVQTAAWGRADRPRAARRTTATPVVDAGLVHAQKLQALGLMTGSVAHDFNNLLFAMSIYTESLEGEVSPKVREQARGIRMAIERAADLTRQILTFARPPVHDETQVTDVNRTLAELKGILDRVVGKTVRVRYELDATFARIALRRSLADQLLLNLVVNARDAMPDGGALTISTFESARTPTGDTLLVIDVSDTGIGMSDTVKARAFEPFFTTKEPGRGTGLGLQTVAQIVQDAEGRIEIDTVPGRGTTIRVSFPLLARPAVCA
jgi:signal transduction histidine kinase